MKFSESEVEDAALEWLSGLRLHGGARAGHRPGRPRTRAH